jgi:hypothetical protein
MESTFVKDEPYFLDILPTWINLDIGMFIVLFLPVDNTIVLHLKITQGYFIVYTLSLGLLNLIFRLILNEIQIIIVLHIGRVPQETISAACMHTHTHTHTHTYI